MASTRVGCPFEGAYFVKPSSRAFFAALMMGSGVLKSGSPAAKEMTSMPLAFISRALAVIARVGEGLMSPQRSLRLVSTTDVILPEYAQRVSQRDRVLVWGCALFVLFFSVFALAYSGTLNLGWSGIWEGLRFRDELAATVVWQLRLPRLAAGLVAGFGLGVVGAVFQTLLRNPLAEPYVMGVSSGAGMAGALVIAFGMGGILGGSLMSLGGIVGGILTLGLVFGLSGWFRKPDVVRLILSGVVVGSMLAAMTTLVLLFGGEDTNVVMRWLLGSLSPMHWERVGVMAGIVAVAFLWAWRQARVLNAFAFSEELAGRLGVDSRRVLVGQLVAGTCAVGAIVGSAGIIGFVGLVAPHLARSLVGPDLRKGLVLSGWLGAGLIVGADFLAQRIWHGAELPVGAVTAVLGSPMLLFLLRRSVYRI